MMILGLTVAVGAMTSGPKSGRQNAALTMAYPAQLPEKFRGPKSEESPRIATMAWRDALSKR